MSEPKWISTDGVGNIFVADSGSGFIQKFDAEGHPLLAFRDRVPKDPFRVAVDSGEGIYSLSLLVNSVQIFTPEGEWFRTIQLHGRSRREWPQGIAIDGDGNIFLIEVLEASQKREFRKITPRGQLLKSWLPAAGSAGQFSPAALTLGADGNLFVVDDTSTQVQEYSPEGELIGRGAKTLGVGEPVQQAHPGGGIGVTSEYVFTAAPDRRGVQVWTLSLQPKIFDDLGGRLAPEETPYQIAVSPRGELLLLDPSRPRVLRFRIHA